MIPAILTTISNGTSFHHSTFSRFVSSNAERGSDMPSLWENYSAGPEWKLQKYFIHLEMETNINWKFFFYNKVAVLAQNTKLILFRIGNNTEKIPKFLIARFPV